MPPAALPPVPGRMAVVRRWRVALAAATIVAGLAAFAITAAGPPQYDARARVLVGPLSGEEKTLRAAGQLTQTYRELALQRPLLNATAKQAGLAPGDLRLTADANSVTRLLSLHVRQSDPRLAAKIANDHAGNLIALAERRGSGSARAGRLRVVEPAVAESRPVGPALAITALAALAGLLGALLLAFRLDRSTGLVTSGEDVEAVTGAPCVGILSRGALRAARGDHPVVEAASDSGAAEEFGLLAAKLDATGGPSLLVVALHGEAGALARNLAAALAAHGSLVALVDVGAENAGFATSPPYPNGNGGPRSEGARAALQDLEAHADVVLLHAAGLERSPTVLAWARVADGTLLVAQRNRTAVRELRATVETLRLVGAPIVGTVLAGRP
jgi:capsular polysaccharide biosynthesis protein